MRKNPKRLYYSSTVAYLFLGCLRGYNTGYRINITTKSYAAFLDIYDLFLWSKGFNIPNQRSFSETNFQRLLRGYVAR